VTFLLDTRAFLWFCQDDPLLSTTAKQLIEDAGNRKLLSVASRREIAIKAGLGKLKLGEPSAVYIPAAISRTGFELLPISLPHATAVESLPLHHRDPFDRLLVSQATIEAIPIVSLDAMFDSYGVSRMW
jgi:PIN domain nuclease of toxin-antitoxin system